MTLLDGLGLLFFLRGGAGRCGGTDALRESSLAAADSGAAGRRTAVTRDLEPSGDAGGWSARPSAKPKATPHLGQRKRVPGAGACVSLKPALQEGHATRTNSEAGWALGRWGSFAARTVALHSGQRRTAPGASGWPVRMAAPHEGHL